MDGQIYNKIDIIMLWKGNHAIVRSYLERVVLCVFGANTQRIPSVVHWRKHQSFHTVHLNQTLANRVVTGEDQQFMFIITMVKQVYY
jgi:hypothetical protein